MKDKGRSLAALILSSVLFGIAMNMFLIPSEIVAGGFSGLAIIFSILFEFPVGITVIFLNIPFLAANAKISGLPFIKKALTGVLLSGIMTEVLSGLEPVFDSRILNAIAGGAVMGFAMGTLFSMGYTTGGTDLVAALVIGKVKALSFGSALFIGDLLVIILALTVTKDISGVLLAVISIYVQTKIIDYILNRERARG